MFGGGLTGNQLAEHETLQQWTCAWGPDVGAVPLQGVSPVCEPIACEFNMPSGERISHNCAGVGMDQVCDCGVRCWLLW